MCGKIFPVDIVIPAGLSDDQAVVALSKALKEPLDQQSRASAKASFGRLQRRFRDTMLLLYDGADDVCKTTLEIEGGKLGPDARQSLQGLRDRHLRRTRALVNRQLSIGYEAAFELGLRGGGATRGIADNERAMLRKLRVQENRFSGNFLTDLEHREGKMDYRERANLYGNALEEVYWLGYLYADLSSDRYVQWQLRHAGSASNWGATENCVDCALLSGELQGLSEKDHDAVAGSGRPIGGRWGNGVYQARELAFMGIAPQSGKLACTTRCHCKLVTADRPDWKPQDSKARPFVSLHPKDFTGTAKDEQGKTVVTRQGHQERRKRYAKDAAKLDHKHINRKAK